jgi:hypothetical protein
MKIGGKLRVEGLEKDNFIFYYSIDY